MIRRPVRSAGGEARDGVMFFVLPPLLLALVFGICAMASHPAEDAPAPAEPVAAVEEEPAVPAPAPAVEEPPAVAVPAAPAAEEDFADEADTPAEDEEPLGDDFEEGEDAPAAEEQI